MCKEYVQVVVAVPVAFEHGRNLVGGIVVVETLRMLDVFVVGDTSVLGDFLCDCREYEVCLKIGRAHV